MKSQMNRINKVITYSCNITSLLHIFDTMLFDFCFLDLDLESQIDIMKIITYPCDISSLLQRCNVEFVRYFYLSCSLSDTQLKLEQA